MEFLIVEEHEILEHRYRFFSERGVVIALEHDKVLITLFSAIIAGLIALVVQGKVNFWAGVFFLVADGLAVMGLGFTLLHMSFSSKVMLLHAAIIAGEENVPNIVEGDAPTEQALQRAREGGQRCYVSQLVYLFLSVASAGIGLAILLWRHIMGVGLVLAVGVLLAVVIAVSLRLWKFRGKPNVNDQ